MPAPRSRAEPESRPHRPDWSQSGRDDMASGAWRAQGRSGAATAALCGARLRLRQGTTTATLCGPSTTRPPSAGSTARRRSRRAPDRPRRPAGVRHVDGDRDGVAPRRGGRRAGRARRRGRATRLRRAGGPAAWRGAEVGEARGERDEVGVRRDGRRGGPRGRARRRPRARSPGRPRASGGGCRGRRAPHAGLVAVVDDGRAGERELEHAVEAERALGLGARLRAEVAGAARAGPRPACSAPAGWRAS